MLFSINTDRSLLVNLPCSEGFSGVFLCYLFQIIMDVNLFKVVPAVAKEPAMLSFSLVLFVPLYISSSCFNCISVQFLWQDSDRKHEERCRERTKSGKKDRHRSRSRSQERDYTYSRQKDRYREDTRVRDWDRKADRSRSPKKSKDKERSKYRWRTRKIQRGTKIINLAFFLLW